MQLYKRKDSASWWVSWSDKNGKRFRRSSGTNDRKLAEALAASWTKEDFLEEHFGKKPDIAFSEVLLRMVFKTDLLPLIKFCKYQKICRAALR